MQPEVWSQGLSPVKTKKAARTADDEQPPEWPVQPQARTIVASAQALEDRGFASSSETSSSTSVAPPVCASILP